MQIELKDDASQGLSDSKRKVLAEKLDELKKVLKDVEEQIVQNTTRPLVYRAQNAGYVFGTDTIDAGRVYARTVYKVRESSHSNASIWFIGTQFNYYLHLPRIGDRIWRTASEHEEYLDYLFDRHRKLVLQIAECATRLSN